MTFVSLTYDTENEQPVPTLWRETLNAIVDAICSDDPASSIGALENVSIGDQTLEISAYQMKWYPASKVSVGVETWNRSICMWNSGYWDVLVDLFVDDDPVLSDLVLSAKVTPVAEGFHFEIEFVYVP